MIDEKYTIEFITPLFSYGAASPTKENRYSGTPEIRAASIRGQLHHWLRLIGGDDVAERAIFGAVNKAFGNSPYAASASKIVVRVEAVEIANPVNSTKPTLPHKAGGYAAAKICFPIGIRTTIRIFERLRGIDTEQHRDLARRAIEAWLLAGSLGLRATRGGGSFHWDDAPDDIQSYMDVLTKRIEPKNLVFDVIGSFASSEEARIIITDTLAEDAFNQSERPLGGIKGRKTSPLKLTVRRFTKADGAFDFRILALWDNRQEVTGNKPEDLRQAIDTLARANKRIGILLQNSSLYNFQNRGTTTWKPNPTPQIQIPQRTIRPPMPR